MITKKSELSDAAIWAAPFSMVHSKAVSWTKKMSMYTTSSRMRGAVIERINVSTEKFRSL